MGVKEDKHCLSTSLRTHPAPTQHTHHVHNTITHFSTASSVGMECCIGGGVVSCAPWHPPVANGKSQSRKAYGEVVPCSPHVP